MKKIFLLLLAAILAGKVNAQQWEWAKGIDLPNSYYFKGVQISCEPSGNFYISTYNWDSNSGHPAGSCLIKCDRNGNLKWRKLLEDKISVYKIQTDNQGNVLLAGNFMDTINIDDSVYVSQNKTDGFLCSLDSVGTINWFKQIAGPGDENAHDIYLDKNRALFLTGVFTNQTNIDGNMLNTIGKGSTYIMKFNTSGDLLSLITTHTTDTNGYNSGYRIQTDNLGNLYILGHYDDIKCDTIGIKNSNYYGAQFLAKFDSIGQLLFLKDLISGTSKFKNFRSLNGGLYFTGDGGWKSGSWTLTKKYSPDGNLIWSKSRDNGSYFQHSSNNIIGNNSGFYTIGREVNPNIPSWKSTYSLIISNFTTNGQESITSIASIGMVEGYDIARTENDEFLIIGYAPDTITFGASTITKSEGEIFIAKFRNSTSTTVSSQKEFAIVIHPNPSYGHFTLQLDTPKDFRICIYAISGNCVYDQQIKNSASHLIDLNNQAKGIYLIELIFEDERKVKKLILH
ncbi:MAG: T9SS type A sorting domain-containing protein [Bacteroidota bacterium]